MKLEEVKSILQTLESVEFELEDGTFVPQHFHVTEVGQITKNFIDCGGTIRHETVINFQLWNANDTDHRLKPKKLLNIIRLSENKLGIKNSEIEVEYQGRTIEKYDLDFNGKNFLLVAKNTNCLAGDKCGVPEEKIIVVESNNSCCSPGGKCC